MFDRYLENFEIEDSLPKPKHKKPKVDYSKQKENLLDAYMTGMIDKVLLITQYKTKPAGKNRKNTVKTIGNIFITFA